MRHRSARIALVMLAVVHCLPQRSSAQRVMEPTLSASSRMDWSFHDGGVPSSLSVARTPALAWSVVRATGPRFELGTGPVPSCRARGPIAMRGLAWGALVGAVVGYLSARDEEYGGAIIGPAIGGAVGAPVGMVTLLLLTPFTPC